MENGKCFTSKILYVHAQACSIFHLGIFNLLYESIFTNVYKDYIYTYIYILYTYYYIITTSGWGMRVFITFIPDKLGTYIFTDEVDSHLVLLYSFFLILSIHIQTYTD